MLWCTDRGVAHPFGGLVKRRARGAGLPGHLAFDAASHHHPTYPADDDGGVVVDIVLLLADVVIVC